MADVRLVRICAWKHCLNEAAAIAELWHNVGAEQQTFDLPLCNEHWPPFQTSGNDQTFRQSASYVFPLANFKVPGRG